MINGSENPAWRVSPVLLRLLGMKALLQEVEKCFGTSAPSVDEDAEYPSPNPTTGHRARRLKLSRSSFKSKFSDKELGFPYQWAQAWAGLNFFALKSTPDLRWGSNFCRKKLQRKTWILNRGEIIQRKVFQYEYTIAEILLSRNIIAEYGLVRSFRKKKVFQCEYTIAEI